MHPPSRRVRCCRPAAGSLLPGCFAALRFVPAPTAGFALLPGGVGFQVGSGWGRWGLPPVLALTSITLSLSPTITPPLLSPRLSHLVPSNNPPQCPSHPSPLPQLPLIPPPSPIALWGHRTWLGRAARGPRWGAGCPRGSVPEAGALGAHPPSPLSLQVWSCANAKWVSESGMAAGDPVPSPCPQPQDTPRCSHGDNGAPALPPPPAPTHPLPWGTPECSTQHPCPILQLPPRAPQACSPNSAAGLDLSWPEPPGLQGTRKGPGGIWGGQQLPKSHTLTPHAQRCAQPLSVQLHTLRPQRTLHAPRCTHGPWARTPRLARPAAPCRARCTARAPRAHAPSTLRTLDGLRMPYAWAPHALHTCTHSARCTALPGVSHALCSRLRCLRCVHCTRCTRCIPTDTVHGFTPCLHIAHALHASHALCSLHARRAAHAPHTLRAYAVPRVPQERASHGARCTHGTRAPRPVHAARGGHAAHPARARTPAPPARLTRCAPRSARCTRTLPLPAISAPARPPGTPRLSAWMGRPLCTAPCRRPPRADPPVSA